MLAALNLEQPDRVPLFEEEVSTKVLDLLLGTNAGQFEYWGASLLRAKSKIGLDGTNIAPACKMSPEFLTPIDEDRAINEWGWIVSREVSCGFEALSEFYLGGYLDTPEKYDGFPKPDPYDPWRIENWRAAKKVAGDRIFLIPFVGGIFDLRVHGIGLKNYLLYMRREPQFIERVLRDDVDFCIELSKILIDEGAEAVETFGDMGETSGPYFSPTMARKFFYPRMREFADAVHKRGALWVLHSDGNVWQLVDMFIDAGVDALNPLQPTAGMRLDLLKERWGQSLCLMGNIDSSWTLPYGTVEDVAREVENAIKTAAPGGGYVMMSGVGVIDGKCKPDNFGTQIQTTKKYGVYPLSS